MAMVRYEIRKALLRPSCQIALLLLLILAGQCCCQVLNGTESAYWLGDDGQTETGPAAMKKLRQAQKEWSGTLDEELLQRALAELKEAKAEGENHPEDSDDTSRRIQGLQNIRMLLNWSFKESYTWEYEDYFLAEKIQPEQLSDFYENRTSQLKDWLYDESGTAYTSFSEAEKQYMIQCYEALETPFQVGYTSGWDMAFRVSYYIILYGSILMAFLVAGIFANEARWKADSVYFSTKLGREKGIASKLAAGFLLTTAVYWSVLLTVNGVTLSLMGFEGGNCPIQADWHFWNRIYNITFSQRSALALADGYLLWLFLSALVMLVSAVSGSLSLSVSVPTLLMLGASLLEHRGYMDGATKILALLPHKMTTVYMNDPLVLYTVFGEVMPSITVQRILYASLTVLMAVGCCRVFQRKQVG